MEFVNDLFLEALYEVIFIRTAKELPVAHDPGLFSLPSWLKRPDDYLAIHNVPRPYAELGGRWSEMFEICCRHYRFVSLAIYLPEVGEDEVEGFCALRWVELFGKFNDHHCFGTEEFMPLYKGAKHFLLDLYFIQSSHLQFDNPYKSDFTDPANLNVVYGILDGLRFTANPRIYYKNLNAAVPYLHEVLNRVRHRQMDAEVVNSPYILSLLLQNQPKIVTTHGRTLFVEIASLDDVFRALEIDSFSEFRFRNPRSEHFSCEGFLERVKTSLKKRSNKDAISIVIEDRSLASDLFGSADQGAVAIDDQFTLIVKRRAYAVKAPEML